MSNEWTHTYPLPADGELQITNTEGSIDVEAADTQSVDVRAERITHATTDRGARDLLTHVNITDQTTDGQVMVRTERIQGLLIGAGFEVNYRVTVPRAATVRLRNSGGSVSVNGISGRVVVTNANGEITVKAARGGVDARTVNAGVTADLADVGNNPVDLRTTNGAVRLTLPAAANANISATSVNGRVDIDDSLAFERFGDSPGNMRRVRGRINAGGTPIELNAVNGDIHVAAREP